MSFPLIESRPPPDTFSGSKTATAACHVAAPRLAAAGAGAGRERRAVGPTDRRTGLQTMAAVLV